MLFSWKLFPSSRPSGPLENTEELLNIASKANAPPINSVKKLDIIHISHILKPLEYSLDTYMRALRYSVQIVQTPRIGALNRAISDCSMYPRPSLLDHQHSLELRFPYVLHQMQQIAQQHQKPEYDLLHRNGSNVEPLFYFLQSYQYYTVYCTYNRNNKESWDAGARYVSRLATHTINTAEFRKNSGVDFMVPASHPKSGPIGVKYPDLSTYQRQAFLRTDMDWNGYTPKDIMVPYYVPTTDRQKMSGAAEAGPRNVQVAGISNSTEPTVQRSSRLLLFFAGGKNPPGGLREKMEAAIHQETAEYGGRSNGDILFTTQPLSSEQFRRGLQDSIFCASVRGDTASSSRLFAIIEAQCIPVIISDWLPLPFERIIDYSKFSVRFPESIVYNVRQLITQLRSFSPHRIEALQQALRTARSLLIYPQMHQVAEFHLLNPVSLTLVEMLLRRKEYCDSLLDHTGALIHVNHPSTMCVKLYTRLSEAKSK